MKHCDMCNEPDLQEYVDGKMRGGPWANMCSVCWRVYGIGKLGTGLGQHYKWREETQQYVKVGG